MDNVQLTMYCELIAEILIFILLKTAECRFNSCLNYGVSTENKEMFQIFFTKSFYDILYCYKMAVGTIQQHTQGMGPVCVCVCVWGRGGV